MVHNLDVEPKRKKKKRANNTTGYRGVSKQKKSYMMQISIDGKRTRIGPFDTAVAAALAYDQAAIKAGKKKSTLNFPDGSPIKIEQESNYRENIEQRLLDKATAAAIREALDALKRNDVSSAQLHLLHIVNCELVKEKEEKE